MIHGQYLSMNRTDEAALCHYYDANAALQIAATFGWCLAIQILAAALLPDLLRIAYE